MRYKALIFDFFGVLCSEISPFWFEEHFTEKGEELRHQYLPPADRGEVSQRALFEELSRMAHVSPEEIEKDWLAHARFNAELIAFIRELKSEYTIGLLSNATSPFFHTVMALSGTIGLFDHVVVSSEVGHAKPEPEIYDIMLSQMGVHSAEAIMIDDNQENLDGALKVGLAGHLFTSVQELREVLGK